MKRKLNIIICGIGDTYIQCLNDLCCNDDLFNLSIFKEFPLFKSMQDISTFSSISIFDIGCIEYDAIFITNNTPLNIKDFLLKLKVPYSKIYTDIRDLIPFFYKMIQFEGQLLNIGTFDIDENTHRLLPSNDLEKFFLEESSRNLAKWFHYFEIYDKHFSKFRNKKVTILEIGVCYGGSLQMWKHYFGQNCRIIGIDINPHCKSFEEDQIEIKIGSQADRTFLQKLKNELDTIDILIDDGGHTMQQQIITFEEMYPLISDQGIYLCEDLHTSYWANYGGGYKKNNTFIEYSKNFIDYINAWHFNELNDSLVACNFKESAHSLHYYDSILVIEKRKTFKSSIFSKSKNIVG